MSKTSASKFDAQFQIRLGHIDRTLKLLLPASLRNRAADRFDLVGNLLGRSRLCSFEQHLRHQTRDSVRLRGLREEPAAKNGAIETSGNRGSSRTRSRSPFESSNFWISPAAIGFAFGLFRAERTLRIERDDRQIVARSDTWSRPGDVVERDLLDGLEIIAAEIEIPSEEPIRAEIRSLSAHGRERVRDDD